MPVGLFFPLGLSVYLIATYQRKLLRQGIDTVMKVSRELKDMINGL
jgi:lipopolysaccharide export system permease protein